MTSNRDDPDRRTTLWAVILIGAGTLFLIGNLGWFSGVASWFWATAFAIGGGGFLVYVLADRGQWWALIPGFALLGLAAAVIGGAAGGGLFLSLLGAGFAAVYALDRTRWWAIIPGGTLITLGAVAWVDGAVQGTHGGWIIFLGLAVTFGLLYLLPQGEGHQPWAIYPALATLALALVILASGAVLGILVPILLIAAGLFLLWRRGWATGSGAPRTRKEA